MAASARMDTRIAIVSKHARAEVQSYENERWRRESARDAELLTPDEQADLLLEWGGYESALSSTRSSFGAVLESARRRSEPRDRPVWTLIEAELRQSGYRMAIDDLVVLIAEKQNLATPHEVRRAIRGMKGAGRLTGYVQDMPRTKEYVDPADGKPRRHVVQLPTEMVALDRDAKGRRVEPLTPEERWRRADEELERYCGGYVPCHETISRQAFEADGVNIGAMSAPPTAGPRLTGLPRVVLERYYGRSVHAPYREVFGELASLVEYTDAFLEARAHVDRESKRRVRSTPSEVLHAMLDEQPKNLAAQVLWRERRKAFIDAVKKQARKLLVDACEVYRLARACA